MPLFERHLKIDFSVVDGDGLEEWAKEIGFEYVDEVPDLEVTMKVEFSASELSDDQIKTEFMKRFRDDEDAVAHAYEHLAAGDLATAMDLMAREFRLGDPSHEKKVADVIARGRAKEVSHAQN